ncbi:putative bifunctional diguanylate cyclase/phosphodiesterase [Antrihabitans cavernicola]|uniref:EAL domain-containing protein n=1 Tax=Antrihabitans cavernicola TaxID=2495913 RepID=A0A5A7SDT5_9NOCA|nr:GGDEF domain-containing phosphodiesterase [Spelaeibacter cavernicola]KAA0024318.1 EAL domain-containing protein [Spelaeibacter cavernicola]
MGVDAATMVPTTEVILARLRAFFGVDHTCLRYNDHEIRASIMIAECPSRDVIPDPDPLGVVYFEDADEVFAQAEHMTDLIYGRPGSGTEGYQERVREGAAAMAADVVGDGVPEASFLAAPLVSAGVPSGFISLTKFGDREFDADEMNAMRAIAALFAQLKARIAAEEQLRHIASHDDLTGLSNRRALLEHMEERLAPGRPGPVATLFIDLDRLKALNDFLGHSAGDQFISAIARRLRDQTDPRDMIARLGGDEFVIVPALSLGAAAAESEAQRIRKLIGERVELGGEKVSRSVSIGVAVGNPGSTSVSDVLRQADQAVMAAKASGGNGIAIFTEEMRAQYELRDDIELNLRHAIESEALFLHYQPEVDLRTGRIEAVEALVRWQHPTRGLLYPGAFIEVAEATNLAGEIGRWVIRSACQQLADWRKAGLASDIVLRINVSPVQLVSLDFVASVDQVLAEFGIDGKSVCFEITEHVVVQDLVRTRITLRGLKDIGVQVAIDDFGTGYSSLAHLKALTVDALKIDLGFVRRLGEDADDLAIVKSIVGLANSFGLGLVAEGVETVIAAETLISVGCYRAQGFLLSLPVAPSEIAKLLTTGYISVDFSVNDEVNTN